MIRRSSCTRSISVLGLVALSMAGSGCAYRGAVYASYQEVGVGVRATAESNAPVKVHVGYDRRIGAFVPRRGGDESTEEATALISKEAVRVKPNPATLGEGNIVEVNGAVITGTAAIVASAPEHASVTILPVPPAAPPSGDGAPAAAPGRPGADASVTYVPGGKPGKRVGSALSGFDAVYQTTDRDRRDAILRWLAADPARSADFREWLGPQSPTPIVWVERATRAELGVAIQRFGIQ